ncbi:MAG: hypothetical protein WB816_09285, partial [Methylocystis sp.]
MPIALSRIALWTLFGVLLFIGGFVLLSACDLAIRPLFGLSYCAASKTNPALVAERERARDLQERVRQAELTIAKTPVCPPTRNTETTPPRDDAARPKIEETLKVPEKVSQLKGCWESVTGDQPIVTDDEQQRVVGHVRICYCFDARGRGE